MAFENSPLVDIHDEWSPLEEMIVGSAEGARVPSADRGLFAIDYASCLEHQHEIPSGPHRTRVVDEANEDLDALAAALQEHGVTVRRPSPTAHEKSFGTPDWVADGQYNYCPRDVLLTIGQTVIESPMVLRPRYFEAFAYRDHLLEYFERGANWLSAPKPRLRDEIYNIVPEGGSVLNDHEPIFDAANVLRVGKDVFYLVSCSGNVAGCRWLQRTLGSEYRVQPIFDVYEGTHIDTTLLPIRPGLVLLNPERIRPDQVPELFRDWDQIWCEEPVDVGWDGEYPRASVWQAMNLIMVNPELAIVDENQSPLIHQLQDRGVEVMPMRMRHARTLSGGFHCVTLDIRRAGALEDYS